MKVSVRKKHREIYDYSINTDEIHLPCPYTKVNALLDDPGSYPEGASSRLVHCRTSSSRSTELLVLLKKLLN